MLLNKKATITLTYDTGKVRDISWNAEEFTSESNLRGNIQSRPFWRSRKSEGLIKVECRL